MIRNLAAISFLLIIQNNTFAHEGHSHSAPWLACEHKQRNDACQYENAERDVFIGSCQQFQQNLMCVRNKPIVKREKPKTSAEPS